VRLSSLGRARSPGEYKLFWSGAAEEDIPTVGRHWEIGAKAYELIDMKIIVLMKQVANKDAGGVRIRR